jgi:phage terminase small subunit
MRGRKPMPTALKILGGEQPCRRNRNEPQFAVSTVDPPKWIRGESLSHWRELAPILLRAGLLTEGDRSALAMLCEEFGRMRRARSAPSRDKARERYRRWLAEFGLTPSSRSRIRATAAPVLDELSAFLSRKT